MDDLAFEIYQMAARGYCCSQIMVKLVLELEGIENQDLVRAAGGLCQGIGGSQKTCGVLTGAIMIFGLYAGKGADQEYQKNGYNGMIADFMEWFEETYDSTDCIDLIGITEFKDGAVSYPVKCGEILKEGFLKVIEILNENGYEPGEREV